MMAAAEGTTVADILRELISERLEASGYPTGSKGA